MDQDTTTTNSPSKSASLPAHFKSQYELILVKIREEIKLKLMQHDVLKFMKVNAVRVWSYEHSGRKESDSSILSRPTRVFHKETNQNVP